MRIFLLLIVLGGLAAALEGAPADKPSAGGATAAKPGEMLLQWHFLGQDQLAGNTNAYHFRQVWRLPSTQRMVQDTLQKLARAPERLFRECLVSTNTPTAGLVRPLLDDLLNTESFGEGQAGAGQSREWCLAARVNDARANLWRTNWSQLVSAFGAGKPAENQSAGFPSLEARRANPPGQTAFARAGQWVVVGWSDGALSNYQEVLRRIKANGRPDTRAANAWLELDANLPRLAPLLHLPATVKWPQASLAVTGKGAALHTTFRLVYAEPLGLKLEPWHIPTNTIREPLVSFTGLKGVSSWLSRQKWYADLGLGPAPDQVFGWAQSQVPFETYVAWRAPNNAASLQQMTNRLPAFINTYVPWLNICDISFLPETAQVSLQRLPIIVPFMRPAPPPENDFVVAGVFPKAATTTKPLGPPELYAQLLSRTNLVYYDWEITMNRMDDWRHLSAIYWMTVGFRPPATNSAPLLWLADTNLAQYLGNAVTELAVVSPRELGGVRSSSVGLTGFELMYLARWLDNQAFPAYDVSARAVRPRGGGRRAPPPPPPSLP